MKNVDLSIIVPFYNEKDNLPKLHQELLSTLAQTKLNCEVIYVNDGSLDQSENVLAGIVNKANEKILTRLVSYEGILDKQLPPAPELIRQKENSSVL